jgi:hypothetical protein
MFTYKARFLNKKKEEKKKNDRQPSLMGKI